MTSSSQPDTDPVALTRKAQEAAKIKRFYKQVSIEKNGADYCISLDRRRLKTPAKADLSVPCRALADAICTEWAEQKEHILPHTMPVTKLVNVSIDTVATSRDTVVSDVAAYAGSDLLCYRAERPIALIDLQAEHWDPVLDWVREELDAPFEAACGVIHVPQPDQSLAAIKRQVEVLDDLRLSAVASMTNLTGSVFLALAVCHGRLEAADAWAAAHVDEDWQIREWGEDEEAAERRARRWREMDAAARVVRLLGQ